MDAALSWLEQAAEERHLGYYFPSTDPLYNAIREQPKFRALTKRIQAGS
ncbi:MAG: hypothetical protein ABI833_21880 [Acidobacteriota bacterium]